MKLQACSFKRTSSSPVEKGVACLLDFNLYDVHFIMDENGCKLTYKQVWSYQLEKPMAYGVIDTGAFESTLTAVGNMSGEVPIL